MCPISSFNVDTSFILGQVSFEDEDVLSFESLDSKEMADISVIEEDDSSPAQRLATVSGYQPKADEALPGKVTREQYQTAKKIADWPHVKKAEQQSIESGYKVEEEVVLERPESEVETISPEETSESRDEEDLPHRQSREEGV